MKQWQNGFTLVELMISVLLALFLLSGLISVALIGNRAYGTHNQHARLQENARFAIELLLRDLRMAGYFGCAHDPAKVHAHLSHAQGALIDVAHALEGFEQGQAAWSPSGATDKLDTMAAHNDAITIRFANPTRRAPTPATMSGPGTKIDKPSGTPWRLKDILVISDCDGADVFQVTAIENRAITPSGTSKAYAAGSELTSLWAARYFVAASNSNALPTLKRQLLQGGGHTTTEELAQGVENLQFLYGEDDDHDGVADAFRRAHQVRHWRQVVGVRFALLIRSLEQSGDNTERDTGTHQVLDHAFDDPNDLRVQRRVIRYTASLRNSALPIR